MEKDTTVKVHLIGICGTAMATLAALLKRRGHDVRGSDEGVYPPMDEFLGREGDSRARSATSPSTSRPTSRSS